ncbi:putative chromosomal organization and DNA repair protein [Rosellinia necatrix]|uniref:Putative chromosomal organization and DNA repair protein n=1 Tax=Rosellinia necatrix TaxID=77044 RepID=A0A1W2TFD8_ROSNE|nr:putative chromosomal organization and DNA repair protein [Rosellinia necatrix]
MPLLSRAQRTRDPPTASSPAQAHRHRRTARLPDYEPPEFPLDKSFHRALAELANDVETQKYEEQLKQSVTLLTNSVRDINDRYVKRKDELASLKRRNQSQSQGEEEDEVTGTKKRERAAEEAVVRLRDTVPSLTAECESAVRDLIDLRVGLEDGRQAIRDTVKKAGAEAAADGEQEDDENAGEDFRMGDRKRRRGVRGPLRILQDEQEKAAADYRTRSLAERYAVDNDYIGFKRLWWDAVHSIDGKPLPDASKWFTGNDIAGEDDDEDEEEDLVIAEEHVSIFCPLSMVTMTEPYTSSVCKHTFNKPAIMQFLRSQPGQKAKCPQTGCNKESSITDFYDDQVMLRKIQRSQADKERRDEDQSDVDESGDASMLEPRSIKAERARERGNQLLANLGLDPEGDDDI